LQMPKINPKIKSIDDLLRIDAEFGENQAMDKNVCCKRKVPKVASRNSPLLR